MHSRRYYVGLILLTTAGALASRLPKLSLRPMHTDEAVHAVKFNDLWETGTYHYDLHEYHGPTLYYCTLPSVWLSGAKDFGQTTETTYRIVPALFGIGLVLLLLLISDGLGRWATACAGVLTALSPAMTFYSRYYIQETLLVFFTFAAIAAGWRYARSRRAGWAILAGAAIGLMHATKETCIIAFGAMAAALLLTSLCNRASKRRQLRPGEASETRGAANFSPRGAAQVEACGSSTVRGSSVLPGSSARRRAGVFVAVSAALLTACVVSATLYSGFFTSASGPLDSLRTFATYFDRAGGHGLHDHPWHYYLRMLAYTHYVPGPWWSEGLILLLAVFGAVAAITGKGVRDAHIPLLRFLTLYTLLLTAIYSAIPYKTPWCMLSFLHGMILLGGVGVVAVIQWLRLAPLRVIAGLLLFVGAGHLGWQAYQVNTRFCADYRNPYVYAHPRHEVVSLAERLEDIASIHPDGLNMLVKVFADDPWPLPWYLRRFSRVGYWEQVPPEPDAPVIIAAAELQAELEARLQNPYQVNYCGLRAPATVLVTYVDRELWNDYVDRWLRPQTGDSEAAGP